MCNLRATSPSRARSYTDIDRWEAGQTKHSTFKTGPMDKPELVDAYKYVFDEIQTIKLVMNRTMSGEGHSSVELRKTDSVLR